jgi:hypothetical protein
LTLVPRLISPAHGTCSFAPVNPGLVVAGQAGRLCDSVLPDTPIDKPIAYQLTG